MWISGLKVLSLNKRSKRFPSRDQVIHSHSVFSSVSDVGNPRDIQRVKLSIGGVQFSGR